MRSSSAGPIRGAGVGAHFAGKAMYESLLPRLCCAVCRGSLKWQAYQMRMPGEINTGVAWCKTCHSWFPVEGGLLELLPPALAYVEDRQRFWKTHQPRLEALGLRPFAADGAALDAQRK